MRRRTERLGEIEGLAAQFLKGIAEQPVVASPRTAARIRLKMRRVVYLDRGFASDAQAIATNASLLYGADRDALRRHPGGQQGLKHDLVRRLKALQEGAHTKIFSMAREQIETSFLRRLCVRRP